jgi:hypothetical protein
LTRARKNLSSSFFNDAAWKDIEDLVETCDDIFHEGARGVLVAFERMKELRPKNKESQSTDQKIYLSFGERTRWPLFQARVRSMMEALLNAKMEITLHILVFWLSWESETRRRLVNHVISVLLTT